MLWDPSSFCGGCLFSGCYNERTVGALALVQKLVLRLLVQYVAVDENKADEKSLLAGLCQFEQFNAQAKVLY